METRIIHLFGPSNTEINEYIRAVCQTAAEPFPHIEDISSTHNNPVNCLKLVLTRIGSGLSPDQFPPLRVLVLAADQLTIRSFRASASRFVSSLDKNLDFITLGIAGPQADPLLSFEEPMAFCEETFSAHARMVNRVATVQPRSIGGSLNAAEIGLSLKFLLE